MSPRRDEAMKSSRDSQVVFFGLLALVVLLAAGGIGLALSYRKTPLDTRNIDRSETRAAVRAWLYENSKSGK